MKKNACATEYYQIRKKHNKFKQKCTVCRKIYRIRHKSAKLISAHFCSTFALLVLFLKAVAFQLLCYIYTYTYIYIYTYINIYIYIYIYICFVSTSAFIFFLASTNAIMLSKSATKNSSLTFKIALVKFKVAITTSDNMR